MDNNVFSNPFDEDDRKSSPPSYGRNTDPFNENKPSFKGWIWVAAALGFICCCAMIAAGYFYYQSNSETITAQLFPTSTPISTRTPIPTATPNLTATALYQQITQTAVAVEATASNASQNWNELISDPFDSNKNNWILKESDDEYSKITYQIADGKYTWNAEARKAFAAWNTVQTKPLTDFYVSVDITQTSGSDTSDYGIIFREDENNNLYYFSITNKGEFGIFMLQNGEWNVIEDYSTTPLIKPGETNNVAVLGQGSQFIFFINGSYLAELTHDGIPAGTTALAIEMADVGQTATFEFDNFELRVP